MLDYVLLMPRRSGIVYPKDAAHLIAWADIAPGHRVLESGMGSGALTLALLRALGGVGELVVYEQRADFIALAMRNVQDFGAHASNLLVREADIYAGLADADLSDVFDRVVLDLPEPWRVLPHLEAALARGGCVAAYTPSIIQASQFVDALRETGEYVQIETHEVMLRGWHIRGAAVRPEHEMVGHTGFVTIARFACRAL